MFNVQFIGTYFYVLDSLNVWNNITFSTLRPVILFIFVKKKMYIKI